MRESELRPGDAGFDAALVEIRNQAAKAVGLAVCKRCGERHCAWVQSKKSGKWYLADALYEKGGVGYSGNGPYRTGGLQVRPWKGHVCGHCPIHDPLCAQEGRSMGAAEAEAKRKGGS